MESSKKGEISGIHFYRLTGRVGVEQVLYHHQHGDGDGDDDGDADDDGDDDDDGDGHGGSSGFRSNIERRSWSKDKKVVEEFVFTHQLDPDL